MAPLQVGQFVLTPDVAGVGKVARVDGDGAVVTFFQSIASSQERQYPALHLQRVTLPPRTRVYHHDPATGSWQMGRVEEPLVGEAGRVYEVRLPNRQVVDVPEPDLQVRCLAPAQDPTEVLAYGGMESQFLHDRRLTVVQALLRARAAGHGLTGLLASAVDLVPHQLQVVRRVLEDPLQRYLLADEVGMGKTIEAGAIIRQCLLDDADATVLVLVPDTLAPQWREELARKFSLGEGEERVSVQPFSKLTRLRPGARALVVVDEAHHLVADAEAYRALAALAHAAQRLLLLSATPVLGAEAATLHLLHLLDPIVYPLTDMDGFVEKVQRRQEYGHILLSLNASGGAFSLRRAAGRALAAFPADATVTELAGALVELPRDHDPAITGPVVQALKRHIAETYRLHQRLLRNRRKDTRGWELLPRRGKLVHEPDLDERMPTLVSLLDDWRYQAANSVGEDTPDEAALAARYVKLWEALGRGVEEFAVTLAAQTAALAAGGVPTFPEEAALLARMERDIAAPNEEPARAELAAQAIRLALRAIPMTGNEPVRLVAFTSSTAFARALVTPLQQQIGRHAVFSILTGTSEAEVTRAVDDFAATRFASVLICDTSGEEGLNLQGAHGVVHLDLPLSPARLEQRLGRLDRFGRTLPVIHHRVLLPSDDDDSPWLAWCDLLAEGFSLFDESISDVQFLLGDLQNRIARALFRTGARGLRELMEPVQEAVVQERARLDEQYALDHLTLGEDEASALLATPGRAETEERTLAGAVDGWLSEVLQLSREHQDQPPDSFRYRWSRHTLMPETPWKERFGPALDQSLTYRRSIAVRHPGTQLVTPGHPLIKQLEQFLAWDDRGTAFATWRREPAWPAAEYGIWSGFRLCYVIEADVDSIAAELGAALSPAELAAVRRRADGLLPPWMETLAVDSALREVTQPALLKLLARPYTDRPDAAGRRDYNLGSRQEALWDQVDPEHFARLCRAVRERSEALVRQSVRFRETLERAAGRASDELRLRNERLARRQAALEREGTRPDPALTREHRINEALIHAAARPRVRLDTLGFIIVTDAPPAGER